MDGQRVVVVTGAASGIGFATAERFQQAGDVVFGLDVTPKAPDGVTFLECDVSDRAAVEAAVARCAEAGRIDVLANVAGVVQFGHVDAITDDEWDRVHTIDLKGPFMMIRAALPHLRASRGCVVNVSSVAGHKAQPYSVAYAAAKGGLTMMTRALAVELAPDRVRVNAVCPGAVDTPILQEVAARYPDDLHPRLADRLLSLLPGRSTSPGEVAAAIAYLASRDARTMTGAVLDLDGGMT